MGFSWERALWPPTLTQWRVIEPERGDWKWNDGDIKKADVAGVQVLGSLMSTPQWAASNDPFLRGGGPYPMAMPSDIETWKTYVRTVVTRYPQVTAWEIFNEPNVGIFWRGNDTDLMRLWSVAAKVIREVRPKALVVGPFGADILKKYGALDSQDVLSLHLYRNGSTVDARIDEIERDIRDERARFILAGRPNIKIWNTEYGPLNWGSLRRPRDTQNHERAVEYIVKHSVSQLSLGVEKLFPYLLAPDTKTVDTMLDADLTPRTGMAGLATVARFCSGAKSLGAFAMRAPFRAYAFGRNGQNVVFVWSKNPQVVRRVEKRPPGLTLYDEMGNAMSGPLRIGEMPRIVVGNAQVVSAFLGRL